MKKIKLFNNYVIKKAKGRKMLVLGCAGYEESGSFARQYLMLEKIAKKIYGLDNNRDFINKFKKNSNVFYGDLNEFNWFKNVPDDINLIVATEVLEHLENPVRVLRYIKENKNKNCKVLISVPNGGSLGRLIHGALNTKMFHFQDREHLCLFNKTTIENCCNSAELKILEIYPYALTPLIRRLLPFSNLASGYFVLCK